MGWLRRAAASIWRRDRHAADLAEEMQFHLEERVRENRAAGMSEADARRDAVRRFGHAPSIREATRDTDVLGWLDDLVREWRQAIRGLRRRPGLLLTAVLSLTLGIGATSAIFSIVDAVLLKPYSMPGADAAVVIRESNAEESVGGNPARLRDLRERLTSLELLSGFYSEDATLAGAEGPTRFKMLRTFGPALELLGATPALGRGFSAEETAGRGGAVVVLSHGTWLRAFGGSAEVLGRALQLDGVSYTVIGVLRAGMEYPEGVDLISPAPPEFQNAGRKARFMGVMGRLRPGISIERAQQELDGVGRQLALDFPATDAGISARLVPLQADETGEARRPLLLLLGAVGLVLLIACVNIATLLLTRADERRHEAAVRVALGAGRGTLIRLYLIESLLLAAGGGAGGLLLAWASVPLLKHLLPAGLPRLATAVLDWRVALFAMAVTLACGLLFGMVPALQAARIASLPTTLRAGGRQTAGADRLTSRRAFVLAQVVLSMVLLVGAGLLGKSLYLMRTSPSGVRPESVLAVRVPLSWNLEANRLHEFYRQGLEAMAALPGVRRAGLVDRLPLEGGSQSREARVEGMPEGGAAGYPTVSFRAASADYFGVMGVPLAAGRLWGVWRGDSAPLEVVVNQTFARRYLDGRGVGSRLTFDTDPAPGKPARWCEVVGIVGDIRQRPDQAEQPAEVFVSYQATYWPLASFVLESNAEPTALAAAVRRAVAAIDPNVIVDDVRPLPLALGDFTAAERVRAALVGIFALSALLLAALGLYGVLASDVAQRRQEIGVRLALGAEPAQVRWMIVRRGLVTTAAGVALGLGLALALGRLVASLLYGIAPTDAAALSGAAMLLLVVAAAVSILPARRASRVDPMQALRQE